MATHRSRVARRLEARLLPGLKVPSQEISCPGDSHSLNICISDLHTQLQAMQVSKAALKMQDLVATGSRRCIEP